MPLLGANPAWLMYPPDEPVPDWVRARQAQATRGLEFVAPKPKLKHALPLTRAYLDYALAEFGVVVEARELEGLDVWFITTMEDMHGEGQRRIVLYEHMGEWLCSSIERVKLFRPDY